MATYLAPSVALLKRLAVEAPDAPFLETVSVMTGSEGGDADCIADSASTCTLEPLAATHSAASTSSFQSTSSDAGDDTWASSDFGTPLPVASASSPYHGDVAPSTAGTQEELDVPAMPRVLRWDAEEGRWVPHHFPELEEEESTWEPDEDSWGSPMAEEQASVGEAVHGSFPSGSHSILEEFFGPRQPQARGEPTPAAVSPSTCTFEPLVATTPMAPTGSLKSTSSEDGDCAWVSSDFLTPPPAASASSSGCEDATPSLAGEAMPKVLRWDAADGRWVPHHFPELDDEEFTREPKGDSAGSPLPREQASVVDHAPAAGHGPHSILEEVFGPRRPRAALSAESPAFVPLRKTALSTDAKPFVPAAMRRPAQVACGPCLQVAPVHYATG